MTATSPVHEPPTPVVAATGAASGHRLAESGAELVALSEYFYRRVFTGTLVFVGLAAAAALALLPLRNSASSVGFGTPTVALAAVLVLAAPTVAVLRGESLYRLLRRHPRLQTIPVLMSAALIAYPLRSELWWPACALLMWVAIIAPLGRTLGYCLLVLGINLAAHAVAGDLTQTPAVAILGLWIGFGFWATTAAVFTDRIAAYLLRLDAARAAGHAPAPVNAGRDEERIDNSSRHDATDARPSLPALAAPVDEAPAAVAAVRLQRLTARQLQVVALLADGLRYQEVAACLSISTRQVQRHVAQAVARLGVRNANELVAVAVAAGMVAPHADAA